MNIPVPALTWLRTYDGSRLRGDLIAAVTLAAYILPAGLGDASLANLPPEAGLYACLFGGLVFWLFCSSRHTVITVTSEVPAVAVVPDTGVASTATVPSTHGNDHHYADHDADD